MKRTFYIFLMATTLLAGMAQAQTGNGKISGTVIDATSGQPVEFATVALNDPSTNKPVDGTVCDEKGKFTISKVANGNYKLVISFIGYETYTQDVAFTDRKNHIELPPLKLGASVTELKEVVVEGQRTLVEEKVDRTVYNAENDQTTKGGDASDVLRRVPMLSVDLDGNVSMRGNSNIRVLINNKPSTIAASSVADALKQIPADQIKSVEVITSPSAKYDAEGSAGIINIITKKNTMQGATLGIDAGVGLRGSNLGLNGNLRTKKMGFNLGGWGRAGYNVTGSFYNDQYTTNLGANIDSPTDDVVTRTIQSADTRNNNLFGRYQLGWDYDINEHNFLTASVRYGVRNGSNYQDNQHTQTFGVFNSDIFRNSKTIERSGTVDVNLDYTHTYEKPQRELSISTQYSLNDRTDDFVNTNFGSDDIIDNRLKNINGSYNQEITAQIDYQTPIAANQLVELGGKEILRKVSSDYAYYTANGSDGEFVLSTNPLQSSNIFNYDQNVTAGYLSYTLSTKKSYSFKAGARYEYTTISANFENPENGNPVIPSYGVLVPSANVSKKLKNGTLKLAYNRRLQRPSIRFLNPNVQAANPRNISFGNPNLDPEFTDNYELSYSTGIKGSSLNFSGFARNTFDAIQNVREVVRDTVIQTTYQNIGKESAYGLSANVNIPVSSKFSLNGGTDMYYAVLDNNVANKIYAARNEGFVISGRLFGNYNFGKGWGAQFFSFFRGRDVSLQGYRGGFRMYSLGFRKDFNNKKGSIGFGAENFLTPTIKIKNETSSPVIVQTGFNEMRNLSFRININYRIGKMSFDGQRQGRRKSVNNDDLKEGGDGGGGMDGGMQGGGQGGQRQGGGQGGARMPVATNAPKVTGGDPTAVVVAEGTWDYVLESPQGGTGVLVLKKDGENYTGTITSSRNNKEIPLTSVTVKGNEITYGYENNFGGNTVAVQVKGVITGSTMAGVMSIGQFASFPIKATRKP